MVKCTGRGLVVKRPGVLSKVQMLNLVLGVGVFSLLPNESVIVSVRMVLQFLHEWFFHDVAGKLQLLLAGLLTPATFSSRMAERSG